MHNIFWVNDGQPARVAIVARPRGDAWLRDELAEMKDDGIDVLISLLPFDEEWALGLADEAKIAADLGLEFIAYPIPDRRVPTDLHDFQKLIARLAGEVGAGKTVGAHCQGCIGRSTVLIASLMIALGADPATALAQIERARGMQVPDTPEQRAWILSFRSQP